LADWVVVELNETLSREGTVVGTCNSGAPTERLLGVFSLADLPTRFVVYRGLVSSSLAALYVLACSIS
jgi:hypothetical protein